MEILLLVNIGKIRAKWNVYVKNYRKCIEKYNEDEFYEQNEREYEL